MSSTGVPSTGQTLETSYSAGNLVMAAQASGTFIDVDTGGAAAARPMDLVLPSKAGQQWLIIPNMLIGSSTNVGFLDLAVIKAAAAVRRLGSNTNGITNWGMFANAGGNIQGPVLVTVQAGDIEAGSVRLRLQQSMSAVQRTLLAAAGVQFWKMGALGPFG